MSTSRVSVLADISRHVSILY